MRHKPIEIVVGWKAEVSYPKPVNGGRMKHKRSRWVVGWRVEVSSPKPKRRLFHVDMGWNAFRTFERTEARKAIPFNRAAILAATRFTDMNVMVGASRNSVT